MDTVQTECNVIFWPSIDSKVFARLPGCILTEYRDTKDTDTETFRKKDKINMISKSFNTL